MPLGCEEPLPAASRFRRTSQPAALPITLNLLPSILAERLDEVRALLAAAADIVSDERDPPSRKLKSL